jgi:D-xylose transport system substrate-binding protein
MEIGGKLRTGKGLRRSVPLLAAGVALVAAACGSSSTPSSSGGSSGSNTVPSVTVDSFTSDITSTMSQFKSLTAYATKGNRGLQVGVILPDTTSSTRYTAFDQPMLTQAFTAAGFTSSQFKVVNAQGSDATEIDDAQTFISEGAKVLIMDPLDGPTGVTIAQKAEAAHVTLISYDRATFQGSKTYYVSFDNEKVGELIGQGFMTCAANEKVASPKVYVLNGGEDTDPNAISFATGYNKVVFGQPAKSVPDGTTNTVNGVTYTVVHEDYAPGWDNTKGGQIFSSYYSAHKNINATIEANDGLANAVITDLKNSGVAAGTVPTTGQDATAQGMAWILEGYQCGSVYKAIYKEAQAAVSLADILLAKDSPPSGLLNGSTTDPNNSSITEPAVLLTPVWVDKTNMESTVVKDGFDTASAICAIAGASVCSSNGIS